jgi:predicted CxxxxCH...CXXCH cytochrome family protein
MAAGVFLMASACQQAPAGATKGEASAPDRQALTQDAVLPPGGTCGATGAHAKHAFTDCFTCHACAGALQFDAAGPAVGAALPPPSFDATTKTCSNVACHAVPNGTFTYQFPGGDGEPVESSVPYGGGASPSATPNWYATGLGCGACHRMPADGYHWHSGLHGNGSATANACETCHSDAVGFTSTAGVVTSAAIATTSTCGPLRDQPCAPFHRNGTVDVTPRFTSACFGCH